MIEANIQRFLLDYGRAYLAVWSNLAQSKKYWRFGARRAKVIPSKLTVRTGKLINSMKKGEPDSIQNVTVAGFDVSVHLGSRVVYANRQNRRTPFITDSQKDVKVESDRIVDKFADAVGNDLEQSIGKTIK